MGEMGTSATVFPFFMAVAIVGEFLLAKVK